MWLAILLLSAALATSGCISRPDGEDGPDGPPGMPYVVFFEQGDLIQTNITFWKTELEVTLNREPEAHPVSDVFLEFYDAGGSALPSPDIRYLDRDGDDNVSEGDVIVFENLTDAHLDGHFEMNGLDEELGWCSIERPPEDQLVLTIGLSWYYPALRNKTLWDTWFQVVHRRTEVPMHVVNVSFDVVSGTGTGLEGATVVYNDTDGDGLVSQWDRVELYGASADYQSARVRFHYDGTLVGIGKLPNFIPSG